MTEHNGTSDDGREIEGEVLASTTDRSTARPRRQVGRRQPQAGLPDPAEAGPSQPSQELQEQHEALINTPGTEESHIESPEQAGLEPDHHDPREDRFAEWQVSALFIVAILATIGFVVAYVLISQQTDYGQLMNFALGGTLAAALFGVGAGMVLWAKKLMPHDKAVQERHPFHSPEEEELEAEEIFFRGAEASGLGKYKVLRRTLLTAMGLLPLPAVLLLRDLGPLPHSSLRQTGWKAGDRLVDLDTKLPVKLGDLEIGGIQTVMPEGFTDVDDFALAPTILIRFAPGQILSQKELNWSADNHVAYSKVCTHAGCPISLYEQQTHHLLCPCHQSTFQMNEDAKVIFGPAARPLPQLQIEIDPNGYFRAKAGYSQPVGPSFWERR